jgi:DNA-binding GntR family transcriptional regulator
MSIESIEHKIRVSIGKALHHNKSNPDGKVDVEHVADEHGVSEDQVREQMAWLHNQNLIGGPLANESRQVSQVPYGSLNDVEFSEAGLAWSMAGYPML